MRFIVSIILLFFSYGGFAQSDSTIVLSEVVVKGFETKQSVLKTPAAVTSLKVQEIQRYDNSSSLPIFNSQTGIRMEERSPGSYRLSIRGSSLRSPYGVRNVKIYWNGIPLSDANGTTYFNLVDFTTIGNIEILKGPSSSIFGAGYGGVVHLNTLRSPYKHHFQIGLQAGSFNTVTSLANYSYNSSKFNVLVGSSGLSTDGYRNHSSNVSTKTSISVSYSPSIKHSISFSQMFSQTDYKTPGGLTLAQMNTNRKASRPATATLPSSAQQNAGIKQHYSLSGLTHNWSLSNKSNLSTSVFFAGNTLQNPFITSYEDRKESTYGYRIVSSNKIKNLGLIVGSEGIFTQSTFDVKENNGGTKGKQMYFTKLNSSQLTHFIQAQYPLFWNLDLTAGVSLNQQQYLNHTTAPNTPPLHTKENPGTPWSPRIALLKTISPKVSVFYTLSNGYSSPTAQEMTANFENSRNKRLHAEKAISNEIGLKSYWNQKLKTELSIYHQNVKNALVRNVLESGEEYFENSGNVLQKGLELSNQFTDANKWLQTNIAANFTLNDFTFGDYYNEGIQLKNNVLPGTSKVNLYFAGRFISNVGLYLNTDFNYLSKVALNSQNTLCAEGFWQSTARLGWKGRLKRVELNIYSGAENLLNQEYSLGYDFNAFGGRFFNPSPKINFNGGIITSFKL